jgi:hypothetical protein
MITRAFMWLLSVVCTWIFIAAEELRIYPGPLTPWIFAWMLGSWPHKVEPSDDKLGEIRWRTQNH